MAHPEVAHPALGTSFTGVVHSLSTQDSPIHQYRGIKYASVPARFRQSRLFNSYPVLTDATTYGPICPQLKKPRTIEDELFGVPAHDFHVKHVLPQDEFECLNLNITCPAGVPIPPQLPVMVWIHGGGDRGSGSSWAYDGAAVVHKSVSIGKPVIVVTLNYRIGLLGFAASPALLADNTAAGDVGVGNYGLHDQRQALIWIRDYISAFNGSPSNVTLFGSSTGAADIVSHLLSTYNDTTSPLFHRAILQSPMIDPCCPTVHTSGSMMSRLLCHLSGTPTDVNALRHIDAASIVKMGWTTRATNDGTWFRDGWQSWFEDGPLKRPHLRRSVSARRSKSRSRTLKHSTSTSNLSHTHLPGNLQAIVIGDSTPSFSTSPLSRYPSSLMSLWTPTLLTRRVKAICQSLSKASRLLRAYDLDPSQSYADDEGEEDDEVEIRVRELVHDARIGWPTERIAQGARIERGGRGVWRYVFDEEGVEDVRCFFDCAKVDPLMTDMSNPSMADMDMFSEEETSSSSGSDGFGGDDDYSDDGVWGDSSSQFGYMSPYSLVRDALQSRWLTFAYGECPWSEDGVYVFGPEGETGERSARIFEGRRKRDVWRDIFEPLGMAMVGKVGTELTRGPATVGAAAGGYKI